VRLPIKTKCAIDAGGLQSFVTNMLTTTGLNQGQRLAFPSDSGCDVKFTAMRPPRLG